MQLNIRSYSLPLHTSVHVDEWGDGMDMCVSWGWGDGVGMDMCMSVWGCRGHGHVVCECGDRGATSGKQFSLFPGDGFLSLAQSSWIRLGWLTSEYQGPSCPHIAKTEMTRTHHHAQPSVCGGFKLKIHACKAKHFY